MGLLNNWHNKVKTLGLVPPKLVTSGPILANVDEGDNIDLLKFPIPRYHELDGGRFFGTCHGVIQRDPDSGYVNVGTYRSQARLTVTTLLYISWRRNMAESS